jgi:hypothetical protein
MNLKQDVEGIHSIIDSSLSYAVNKRRKKQHNIANDERGEECSG